MDPFIRQFGEYNAKTKTYAIPAYFLSFMNSERGSCLQEAQADAVLIILA
jgi:hypothetical protein